MTAFLEWLSKSSNRILVGIAGCCLVVMLGLTCTNIVLRLVAVPIRGTVELMGLFGAVLTACALGFTQRKRAHISVDILFHAFPQPVRRGLECFNCLVCAGFFGLVAWQIAGWATTLRQTGEVTETLRIIYYPFTYAVALGFGVLAFVFLADLLILLTRIVKARA
jgi:TRAP-type C4-dicarboxylate transport system permease small subunit